MATNNNATVERKFYYKATRGIIETCVKAVGLILLYIAFRLVGYVINRSYGDGIEDWMRLFGRICLWGYVVISVYDILNDIYWIYTRTYRCMTIKNDEITYSCGWLSKQTITIPVNRIRTCSKSSTLLQRMCGTMSISITTSGDDDEIYFSDIQYGENAYLMILEKVKKT